jgi:hypothetical protein
MHDLKGKNNKNLFFFSLPIVVVNTQCQWLTVTVSSFIVLQRERDLYHYYRWMVQCGRQSVVQ